MTSLNGKIAHSQLCEQSPPPLWALPLDLKLQWERRQRPNEQVAYNHL